MGAFDGTNLTFYVDGVRNKSTNCGGFSPDIDTTGMKIGSFWANDGQFDGTIDEFLYVGRALTPEQILALYNNRTDLIVSQETASDGQNWSVCVTPNDGTVDGTTTCSVNLGVGVVPVASGLVVNSTTGANLTTENITAYISASDADETHVELNYDWRLNDTSIAVLNYNFDIKNSPGTGETKDYSTYNRNGTIEGGVPYVRAGLNGSGAYDFQGSGSGDGVNTGTWNISTAAFSAEAWFYADSYQAGYNSGIISKWDNVANKRSWALTAFDSSGYPNLCISSSGTNYNCTRSTTGAATGKWHHVVATYNGSGGRSIKIYLDGVLESNNNLYFEKRMQKWESFDLGRNCEQIRFERLPPHKIH